eukprot:m.517052 g.517052  ORF g.517052 m.517052 type:complete len:62 (-) comp21935_c0_seq1:2087-2272(-)
MFTKATITSHLLENSEQICHLKSCILFIDRSCSAVQIFYVLTLVLSVCIPTTLWALNGHVK